MKRRSFLHATAESAVGAMFARTTECNVSKQTPTVRPNLIYVFADQWRAQATGYAGDPNAHTPNLDRLAGESVNFASAVSVCPVCSPYRASLMTGRYPLTHGVFVNDVQLNNDAVSIAQAYARAGYDTAYIGKWHLDGRGRSNYIPRDRRQGFDYWKAMECTHKYNSSFYYADDDPEKHVWEGYDAIAQTRDAQDYIRTHAGSGRPFILFLSWGPPHAPYDTAPQEYKDIYEGRDIVLRPNVPQDYAEQAKKTLAGYYAHIATLDNCIGNLLATIEKAGIAEDTILAFTSDHGDMLFSQGEKKKQKPWDESIRVPFLLRYPRLCGTGGRTVDIPIGTPDIMPTLLGLSGVPIPATAEGRDYSGVVRGLEEPSNEAVLITCPSLFGQWPRGKGREYRGVYTRRYTYVRDLNGPWLLYDNVEDPYQLDNLVGNEKYSDIQRVLDATLEQQLARTRDEFFPGTTYIAKWGYKVDEETGTVPYTK
jgi:arylsulfatase A-like enzyme